MINILSYVGMNMQSELCLWTLLGLVRTIFDATLFKVNSNLKQVWQMSMPEELSLPVQRALRTVISGVMLVQCFTVYVYLASYIVLLYPVFLEERPALVLPWLLLAAIRKLLCELTSLSLGLGTCVLLGPARPPCIKFLVVKVASIMPAFYMWMLVFSYYHVLKVASAFKTFPPVLPSTDLDYGLELAVRRRRTKSLLDEDQLRRKLEASFYSERNISLIDNTTLHIPSVQHSSLMAHSTETSIEDMKEHAEAFQPMSVTSNRLSDAGTFEDWFGNEVVIPRDTDRILEQFVLMLLRISVYLRKRGSDTFTLQSFCPRSQTVSIRTDLDCPTLSSDTDTPGIVRSRQEKRPSYLRDYPEMFTRKSSDIPLSARRRGSIRTVQNKNESDADGNVTKQYKRAVSINCNEKISLEVERVINRKKQLTKKSSRKRDSSPKPKSILNNNDEKTNNKGVKLNGRSNSENTDEKNITYNETNTNGEVSNNNLFNNDKVTDMDIPQEQKVENDSQASSSPLEHADNIDNNKTSKTNK